MNHLLRRAVQALDDLTYEEDETRKLRMRLETQEKNLAQRRKLYNEALGLLQAALNRGER